MRTVLLFAALVACGKSGDGGGGGGGAAGTKKTIYSCFIQVGAKAESYSGKASGPDEKKVGDDAWADVCGKLPAADQANCKDGAKWSVAESGGSVASGGKTTFSKTLTLTRKSDNFEGKAKSEVSSDEACKAAKAEACKKAGAEGDCIASGKFDLKGNGTGTETETVK